MQIGGKFNIAYIIQIQKFNLDFLIIKIKCYLISCVWKFESLNLQTGRNYIYI